MPRVESHTLPPAKEKEFQFNDWVIKVRKSHILGSKCQEQHLCSSENIQESCTFCRYQKTLKLSSLPDMVFADNALEISHTNGGRIEFNAFNALQCIGDKPEDAIQVAHSKSWKEARSDCQYANNIAKDYDWTYTTSYRGTLHEPLISKSTTDNIDLDRLRVKEEIKFFEEIYLYEDELDDNGSTKCTIKVRVMPSGFFVVFRHYLRVDHVIIKINDTRLYHPQGSNYILRESSRRQQDISKLTVPPAVYKNPDLIWEHLPLVEEIKDKLIVSES